MTSPIANTISPVSSTATSTQPGLVARRVAALEGRPITEVSSSSNTPSARTNPAAAPVDAFNSSPRATSVPSTPNLSPAASIAPSVVARDTETVAADATSLWGEDARLTTEDAAKRLRDAMKGIGCNNKEVFRLLSERSAEEIKLIRQDFRKLTGDSLTSWLKSNLWGNHFKQAML